MHLFGYRVAGILFNETIIQMNCNCMIEDVCQVRGSSCWSNFLSEYKIAVFQVTYSTYFTAQLHSPLPQNIDQSIKLL